MHIALYRKYRPKTFDEVVGQDYITRSLKNEIASGRVAHAYLLTGSRGTGKTSCAKLIAKAANCLEPQDGNPCCKCDICRGVEDESILDVVEIDAASNNGVDSIRQLKEEANFTPARAKYRVYIIDEVHMLSAGAFNALLKIMEEPPEHVIFILATTEAAKVPPTVVSRCQRFNFRRIKPDVVLEALIKTAQAEGIELDREAAGAIANLSEGAMRDALSLLDVCASYSEPVTQFLVAKAAGLASQDYLFELADYVLAGDSAGAISAAKDANDASVDAERLCEQLILHYRNLMISKTARDASGLIICMPRELERYKEQGSRYGMALVMYCLGALQDAMTRLSRSANKRAELEMCLIRLCNPQLGGTPEALSARIEKLELALRSGARIESDAREWTSSPLKAETQAPPPMSHSAEDYKRSSDQAEAPEDTAGAAEFGGWRDVLTRLEGINPGLYASIRDSKAYERAGVLFIESGNELVAKMLKDSSYSKSTLDAAIKQTVGRSYEIRARGAREEAAAVPAGDILRELGKRASDAGASVNMK